jgi:hypothetical protein
MKLAEAFRLGATQQVQAQVDELRGSLDFDGAAALPEIQCRDIVIVGREATLTVFRQLDRPAPGHVLVTVQVARHSLGGLTALKIEKGVVFPRGAPARDATDEELLASEH